MQRAEVVYKPTDTLKLFHEHNDPNTLYRMVLGPVRSGKSTGMTVDIFSRILEQKKGPDGIRRSRWAAVRQVYRELYDTTLATWMLWFPDGYTGLNGQTIGWLSKQDSSYHFKFDDVEADILFRALERPEDIKKLLSLELTGAWINEAREIPKTIVDGIGDRVGQWPPKDMGGCSWRGVMLDSNMPDDDHWIYHFAEGNCPPTWKIWKQPGGMIETGIDGDGRPVFITNPNAENLENIEPNYYETRSHGKDPGYVRVYYCAQYGFSIDGKPVIPEFVDRTHVAKEKLVPLRGVPIRIGVDFGLTPAFAFAQRLATGRWIVFDELCTEDMGIENATKLLCNHINDNYKGYYFEDIAGDPAGEQRAQTDENTPFMIMNRVLREEKMPMVAYPAPSNDFTIRRDSLGSLLNRMVDGYPAFLLSPGVKTLRKALNGGYHYKRIQIGSDERYLDTPVKNKYSHIVEALEYALIGAGEGANLVHGAEEELDEDQRRELAMAGRYHDGRSRVCGY